MMTNKSVCVHGLGYVGLPTAAILANSGYKVSGFDVDTELRGQLQAGVVDLDEPDLSRFVEQALDDGLRIVSEVEAADVHLICVPTPYDKDLDRTNLSFVESSGEAISDVLRNGDVVVLESTVPPGTTAETLRPILERSGLSANQDFVLGYSPETVLPGDTLSELRNNDRIVGTVGNRSPDRIVPLYESFTSGDIRTTNATTAEFVKLIQNGYRDVNIAFANEVAKLAHEFGIDSRDAIALANNHPRVDILQPGPGVGGHCIPIDPLFLNHSNDIPMLIETARTVNDGMPAYVTGRLAGALEGLSGATIAVIGVAYKGGVADTRESPSLVLADRLEAEGVSKIRLTDPYVDATEIDRDIVSLEQSINDADAAIIVTDHPEYGALTPSTFSEEMRGRVILDTRDMLTPERWEAEGFIIHSI